MNEISKSVNKYAMAGLLVIFRKQKCARKLKSVHKHAQICDGRAVGRIADQSASAAAANMRWACCWSYAESKSVHESLKSMHKYAMGVLLVLSLIHN